MILPQEWLYDSILYEQSNEEQGIEFVEKTKWLDEGKFDSCEFIFKYQEKYYSVQVNRSGTYYNGYELYTEDFCTLLKDAEELDCHEVVKKERITYYWDLA